MISSEIDHCSDCEFIRNVFQMDSGCTFSPSSMQICQDFISTVTSHSVANDGLIGTMALHAALELDLSLVKIQTIVDHYPDCVKGENKNVFDRTALMIAISKPAPIPVVQFFLSCWPHGARVRDSGGMTALLLAAEYLNAPELIQKLIISWPGGVKCVDNRGRTVLTCALAAKAPVATIKMLLQAYPGLIEKTDEFGSTPLLIALQRSYDSEFILELIRLFPKAVKFPNILGATPLLQAVYSKASLHVVLRLISEWPDACNVRDRIGHQLPFYADPYDGSDSVNPSPKSVIESLFAGGGAWSDDVNIVDHTQHHGTNVDSIINSSPHIVKLLFNYYPETIRLTPIGQREMLMRAVSHSSIADVKTITKNWPEAVRTKRKGLYPIQVAVAGKSISSEIVRLLLRSWPESIDILDVHQQTLFHLADETCDDASKIKILVAAAVAVDSKALEKKNTSGMLPLHFHISNKRPNRHNIIKELVTAHPRGLLEKNCGGKTPLHVELSANANEDIVRLLLRSGDSISTEVLRRLDNKGRTPLHLAIVKCVPVTIITLLISEYPDGAKLPDSDGRVPLHTAIHRHAAVETINSLLHAWPNAIVEKDGKNSVPLSSIRIESLEFLFNLNVADAFSTFMIPCWCHMLDAAHSYPVKSCERICRAVFARYPSKISLLINATDSTGRGLYGITYPQIRNLFNEFTLFCGRFKICDGAPIHRSATAMVVRAEDHDTIQDYRRWYHSVHPPSAQGISLEQFEHLGDTYGIFPRSSIRQMDDVIVRGVYADWKHGSIIEIDDHFESGPSYIVLFADDGSKESLSVHSLRLAKEVETIHFEFNRADANQDNCLSEEEFVSFCKQYIGTTQHVVLKFMKFQDQYDREHRVRSQLEKNMYLIPLLLEPNLEILSRHLPTCTVDGYSLAEYRHLLVMPEADRSLDAINRYENLDTDRKRAYGRDVADCLCYLHRKGWVHGDVKMKNAVRLNNKVKLVDMDAAAHVHRGYIGTKFSTAVLPPEMFAILNEDEKLLYEAYWKDEKANNPSLWKKLQPILVSQFSSAGYPISPTICQRKQYIVVKAFAVGEDNLPRRPSDLPYELLPADPKIDSWSFGIMMFQLLCNHSLFFINNDEDLVNMGSILGQAGCSSIADWMRDMISSYFDNIERDTLDEDAIELLKGLLDINMDTRWSINQALGCNYFTGRGQSSITKSDLTAVMNKFDQQAHTMNQIRDVVVSIEVRTVNIENWNRTIVRQLQHTTEVLLKASIEAVDVRHPTSFIIVNQKYQTPSELAALHAKSNHDKERIQKQRLSKAETWLTKLAALTSSINNAIQSPLNMIDEMQKAASALFTGEKLYFYLVDEVTMAPVVLDRAANDMVPKYPITITVQPKNLTKLLPFIRTGFKAARIINGLSAVANMLGYPVPHLSETVMKKMDVMVGNLDKPTSVAEYAALQDCVMHAHKHDSAIPSTNAQSTNSNLWRGACLRELDSFLKDHDPQADYCGLRRVMGQDGICIWTSEEKVKELQQQHPPPLYNPTPVLSPGTSLKKATILLIHEIYLEKLRLTPKSSSIINTVMTTMTRQQFAALHYPKPICIDILHALCDTFLNGHELYHNISSTAVLPQSSTQSPKPIGRLTSERLTLQHDLGSGPLVDGDTILNVLHKCTVASRVEASSARSRGAFQAVHLSEMVSIAELEALLTCEADFEVSL